MSVGYVLAPEAALDLIQIWRYIKNKAALRRQTAWNQSFGTGFCSWPERLAQDIGAGT